MHYVNRGINVLEVLCCRDEVDIQVYHPNPEKNQVRPSVSSKPLTEELGHVDEPLEVCEHVSSLQQHVLCVR
eukprot:1182885-Prorocentrum_minimum.AAC.2